MKDLANFDRYHIVILDTSSLNTQVIELLNGEEATETASRLSQYFGRCSLAQEVHLFGIEDSDEVFEILPKRTVTLEF